MSGKQMDKVCAITKVKMNNISKKFIDLNVATHEISTMLKLVKFKDDVNYVIQTNPILF